MRLFSQKISPVAVADLRPRSPAGHVSLVSASSSSTALHASSKRSATALELLLVRGRLLPRLDPHRHIPRATC